MNNYELQQKGAKVREEAVSSAAFHLIIACRMTEDWITDRRPTAADSDADGDVRLRDSRSGSGYVYVPWEYVAPGAPWLHLEGWRPPVTSPPTLRFVAISRTIDPDSGAHILDAVDSNGTAWWKRIAPREVDSTDWEKLSPLPQDEGQAHG